MKILKTIGIGNESVYVYYYENDLKLARLENRDIWECKIGYTINDAIGRINDQGKTSRASTPIIGLIIKTDRAALLESKIHKALYESKIECGLYTGNEWFLTTPDIVEQFYLSNVCPDKQLSSGVSFAIQNSKELGSRLKTIRKTLKLPQEKICPGNRQMLIRTENGGNISIDNLFPILAALNYELVLMPIKLS